MNNGYSTGYIFRRKNGSHEGVLDIEGVEVSPIEGMYFKEDGTQYLWLKRKPTLEYDDDECKYVTRASTPSFEAYLRKTSEDNVAYRGEFTFLRFRYTIVGIWDTVFGSDKSRLNLYVERMPMSQQKIINSINERYKKQ